MQNKQFNKEYFTSINYSDYLSRQIRYEKCAKELVLYLANKINLTTSWEILDYGCAVGFLVNGFRKLGYSCDGYDISTWAKREAKKRGVEYVNPNKHSDLVIFLDVLEHMTDEDIRGIFNKMHAGYVLVRIPCSTNGGKSFHLDVSNKDKTHINCKTKYQWLDLFKSMGYSTWFALDLYTIYDSDGVMCKVFKKD